VFLVVCAARAADQIPISGHEDPRLAAFDQMMVSFMRDHDVPGASLAIARNGGMVYARGFGCADVERHEPVEQNSHFRIASISKPFTAVAILQLQERGKLRLDDPAFGLLGLKPHLEAGATVDSRLWKITIRQLLNHTSGFDRDACFDPMFRSIAIAKAMGTPPPARQQEIIEYMMGRPLDFDPGTREAYSNFGYCVLGRVVEKVSGQPYAQYVEAQILKPLGVYRMYMGLTRGKYWTRGLGPGIDQWEVHYYPCDDKVVTSVFGDGKMVPIAYGGWCLEAMDSHGGWVASAQELVRFASSFDDPENCPILNSKSIAEMSARPQVTGYEKDGTPKAAYYACGWEVRQVGKNKLNMWHAGLLDGSASLLVRRYDGLTWAVLFNRDRDSKNKNLTELIDPLIHKAADSIKDWPLARAYRETPFIQM
jgi:N-acyl-D-amino-acid deacylase